MRKKTGLYILLFIYQLYATNGLEKCWQKQVETFQNNALHVQFDETETVFSHSMKPWKKSIYTINGTARFNSTSILKSDTLITQRGNTYYSQVQSEENNLLFTDYGDTDL